MLQAKHFDVLLNTLISSDAELQFPRGGEVFKVLSAILLVEFTIYFSFQTYSVHRPIKLTFESQRSRLLFYVNISVNE